MSLGSLYAEIQHDGVLLAGFPLGQQLNNLPLTRREYVARDSLAFNSLLGSFAIQKAIQYHLAHSRSEECSLTLQRFYSRHQLLARIRLEEKTASSGAKHLA